MPTQSPTTVASEAIATQITQSFLTALGEDAENLTQNDLELIGAASTTIANNTIALVGANAGNAVILQEEITEATNTIANIGLEMGLEAQSLFQTTAESVIQEVISLAVQAAIAGIQAEISDEIPPVPANQAAIDAQKAVVAAREANHNQRVENRKRYQERQAALKEGRLNPDGSSPRNPVRDKNGNLVSPSPLDDPYAGGDWRTEPRRGDETDAQYQARVTQLNPDSRVNPVANPRRGDETEAQYQDRLRQPSTGKAPLTPAQQAAWNQENRGQALNPDGSTRFNPDQARERQANQDSTDQIRINQENPALNPQRGEGTQAAINDDLRVANPANPNVGPRREGETGEQYKARLRQAGQRQSPQANI